MLEFESKMALAKFEGNRVKINREITENHAILVNLMARKYNEKETLEWNFVM